MTPHPPVPHLDYEQLRRQADAFLGKYHAGSSIPIPIDRIIDHQLQIYVLAVPGLEEAIEMAGYTSSDLTEIAVDHHVYYHQPGRYRFTLAHEVGHVILHAELYREHRFNTIDQWKQFIRTQTPLDMISLETQADCFAGLILAPKRTLEQVLRDVIGQVKAYGVNQRQDFVKGLIVDMVASRLEVSSGVIWYRLNYDKFNWSTLWS